MPIGPGKYDDEATLVRNRTDAAAVVLVIADGTKGSGFSAQFEVPGGVRATAVVMNNLAGAMEEAARDLRAQAAQIGKRPGRA